jgi:hypothetical protein
MAVVRAQLAYAESILNGESASALSAYFDVYQRAVESIAKGSGTVSGARRGCDKGSASVEFTIRVLLHY